MYDCIRFSGAVPDLRFAFRRAKAIGCSNGQGPAHSAAYPRAKIGANPERVVPLLILSLQDRHPQVRAEAVEALGLFGAKAKVAIPALSVALHDKDPFIREMAGEALNRIDPEAVTELGAK